MQQHYIYDITWAFLRIFHLLKVYLQDYNAKHEQFRALQSYHLSTHSLIGQCISHLPILSLIYLFTITPILSSHPLLDCNSIFRIRIWSITYKVHCKWKRKVYFFMISVPYVFMNDRIELESFKSPCKFFHGIVPWQIDNFTYGYLWNLNIS